MAIFVKGVPNWVRGYFEIVDTTTRLKRAAVAADVDSITYSVDGGAAVTLAGGSSPYLFTPAINDEAGDTFNFSVQLPASIFTAEVDEMEILFTAYKTSVAVASGCVAGPVVKCAAAC